MASAEFWDLTWDEYFAREDQFINQERRWDERFGLIAATYINTKLKEGTPPVKPGAFFGYTEAAAEDSEDSEDREMTVEESIAYMRDKFTPKVK